jgi:hypothetical protein
MRGNMDQKTKEIAEDLNKIQNSIQKKVDKVNKKIEDLEQKMKELEDNTIGHSERWINDQKSKIQKKIDDLKVQVQEFMDEKMQVAQEWMDTQKKAIAEKVAAVNAAVMSVVADALAKIADAIPEEEEEDEENSDGFTSESNNDTQEDYNAQAEKDLLNTNKLDYNDTQEFVAKAEKYTYIVYGSSGINQVEQYISIVQDRLYRNQYADTDYRNSDENFVQSLNDILNRLTNEMNIRDERYNIEADLDRLLNRAYNDECTLQELMAALEIVNRRLEENNYFDPNWKSNDIYYRGNLEALIEEF